MRANCCSGAVLVVAFLLSLSWAQTQEWQWHTVQKGETLYGLARQYQTTVNQIVQLNGWKAPRPLKVGEKIRVPAKVATPTAKPSPQPSREVAQKKPVPSLPPTRLQVLQVQVGKAVVLTIRNLRS